MSDNSNELTVLDYECCDEHELSYIGECPECVAEDTATSSDELKCKQCGEFVFNDWLSCEDGEFCNHACAEKWKWGSGRYKPTAASSDGVVISREDAIEVTQILFMYAAGYSVRECLNIEASMKAAENLKLRIDQAIKQGG